MAGTLTRWDPIHEFASLRSTMDRLLEDAFGRAPVAVRRGGEEVSQGSLGVDVYETPIELVVQAAVPGVDPKDLDISVEEDVLTIKGESRSEAESEENTYHRREIRYGAFQRVLRLPPTVDAEKASASFEHGMLKLAFPKKAEARTRTIKIRPAGVVAGESQPS